mmetsp:Transcript_12985/g.34746  ORF Transcript_12985/g.34746 Transcript_12985/m.34746 type:complete len:119 (-) Transcript_12985:181-537(-)
MEKEENGTRPHACGAVNQGSALAPSFGFGAVPGVVLSTVPGETRRPTRADSFPSSVAAANIRALSPGVADRTGPKVAALSPRGVALPQRATTASPRASKNVAQESALSPMVRKQVVDR